jgi:glycine oxidase
MTDVQPTTTKANAPRERTDVRVAIVGGGVIGLSIAWALAQDGHSVEVFDDQPGLGASYAAAGMLAPVSEVMYEEPELLALGLASLQAWPEFAARLTQASGMDVGMRQQGSMLVGFNADDAVALTRAGELLSRHELPNRRLTSREARTLEPALSPRTSSALLVPGDHSVDNRKLVSALLEAAERAGVQVHRQRVSVVTVDGQAVGVRRVDLAADAADAAVVVAGDVAHRPTAPLHEADLVILAAGPGSADVPGLLKSVRPPVRPVKGQSVRLAGANGLLERTIRATVHGERVYLVPRNHGELVVGATSEEVEPHLTVTAGAVHQLLRKAIEVVPEVSELELVESLARFRPGTPDNGPLIGRSTLPGLLVATGHYRAGILLAPATSDAIRRLVSDLPLPGVAEPFAPQRFSRSTHDVKENIA